MNDQPQEPRLSRDATVTVYGASDDLVEVEGAISDEFGCFSTGGGTLTFSDGTVLRVNYAVDGTGCWRIVRLKAGSAAYTHRPATDEETDYSDRVTLTGALHSVRFRASKAPARWPDSPPSAPALAVDPSRSTPEQAEP